MSLFRKIFFYSRNSIIIVAPLVLLLLPATYFDKGESICLSKQLAGMECYACGLTKAVMHLIHFDFKQALDYNWLSFIVVPLLFPLWLKAVFEIQGKKIPGKLGELI